MNPLYLPLLWIGGIYILWILYLAVMNLKRARDAGLLTPIARYLGYPIFLLGILLDVIFNFLLFSPLVLNFSPDLTISDHINHLLRKGKPWQRAFSRWVCHNLLDAFDPSGNHCDDDRS